MKLRSALVNSVYVLIENGNFREFFTERGEFFSFKTGIPSGPAVNWLSGISKSHHKMTCSQSKDFTYLLQTAITGCFFFLVVDKN